MSATPALLDIIAASKSPIPSAEMFLETHPKQCASMSGLTKNINDVEKTQFRTLDCGNTYDLDLFKRLYKAGFLTEKTCKCIVDNFTPTQIKAVECFLLDVLRLTSNSIQFEVNRKDLGEIDDILAKGNNNIKVNFDAKSFSLIAALGTGKTFMGVGIAATFIDLINSGSLKYEYPSFINTPLTNAVHRITIKPDDPQIIPALIVVKSQTLSHWKQLLTMFDLNYITLLSAADIKENAENLATYDIILLIETEVKERLPGYPESNDVNRLTSYFAAAIFPISVMLVIMDDSDMTEPREIGGSKVQTLPLHNILIGLTATTEPNKKIVRSDGFASMHEPNLFTQSVIKQFGVTSPMTQYHMKNLVVDPNLPHIKTTKTIVHSGGIKAFVKLINSSNVTKEQKKKALEALHSSDLEGMARHLGTQVKDYNALFRKLLGKHVSEYRKAHAIMKGISLEYGLDVAIHNPNYICAKISLEAAKQTINDTLSLIRDSGCCVCGMNTEMAIMMGVEVSKFAITPCCCKATCENCVKNALKPDSNGNTRCPGCNGPISLEYICVFDMQSVEEFIANLNQNLDEFLVEDAVAKSTVAEEQANIIQTSEEANMKMRANPKLAIAMKYCGYAIDKTLIPEKMTEEEAKLDSASIQFGFKDAESATTGGILIFAAGTKMLDEMKSLLNLADPKLNVEYFANEPLAISDQIERFRLGQVDVLLMSMYSRISGVNLQSARLIIILQSKIDNNEASINVISQVIGRAQRPMRKGALNLKFILNSDETCPILV